MKIVFGMQLDGTAWGNKDATIGVIRTGPMGFLGILETQLGISMKVEHPVHRIDGYMKRMQQIDRASIWYHESFASDQWSTARRLLELRDELIEAGWDGQETLFGSPRLDAITELEKVDVPLLKGKADRLRKVTDCLESNMPVHIDSISLTEPLSILTPAWQKVINLIQSQGADIKNLELPERKTNISNLSKIQALISKKSEVGTLSSDDDTLILLKADNEWEAAEHLALWLASKCESNDQVTIICGTDTSVLDQVLKRYGLPCLGRAMPSRWREIQQILSLILANAWQPVDIRLVVELLSLTLSVLPKWACNILLKAVAKEPGIGGKAWQNALVNITEENKKLLIQKEANDVDEKTEVLLQTIQSLLVDDRFDPLKGIPEDKLRERCQVMIDKLAWRIEQIPALIEVISQAREIQKLSIGKGFISRIMLERMLDTIIGPGNKSDAIKEEAAPWKLVDHPSQITDDCSEIVWWGFNANGPSTPDYWSFQERTALNSCGIDIEETASYRSREAYEWQRGFMHAEKRFLAVHISQIRGEEAEHHPYWDTIWSLASRLFNGDNEDGIKRCIYKECKDFGYDWNWKFAGRENELEIVQEAQASLVTDLYVIPESTISPPVSMSYSQMNTLIGCPFEWTLKYYAGLKPAESQSIPTGNQMIGTFCHRIVEELYSETNYLDSKIAYEKAGYLFDSLINYMASELLTEGNAAERQRYRTSITEAVRQLVTAINRFNLTVEKTEALLEGEVEGIPYKGYVDILLRDLDGNPFLLDLKWSASDKYKTKEIEDGTSLQLAAYAWMIRSAEPSRQVNTAYFMLAQGKMLSTSPMLLDEAVESPYGLEETWDRGVNSLEEVLKSLETGSVHVCGIAEKVKSQELGVPEEKAADQIKEEYNIKGLLYQSPPCRFCDFVRLCGIKEDL